MSLTSWCPGCRQRLPLDCFWKRPGTTKGVRTLCKACGVKSRRTERRIASVIREAWSGGLVGDLLAAAKKARTAGMWRGREAIRAYAELGRAIEAFGAVAGEGETEATAAKCRCPQWPCPKHADDANPRDAA